MHGASHTRMGYPVRVWANMMSCHAADGPPPQVVPRTIYDNFLAVDGPPGPSVAAIDGPPLPQVVPSIFWRVLDFSNQMHGYKRHHGLDTNTSIIPSLFLFAQFLYHLSTAMLIKALTLYYISCNSFIGPIS